MKYFSTLAGTFLILNGCTSMDVKPIPASAKLERICIEFNSEVNVDDFVPVVQEDFFSHGITSVVYRSARPTNCPFRVAMSWRPEARATLERRMLRERDFPGQSIFTERPSRRPS
jgi:hypothetical protein